MTRWHGLVCVLLTCFQPVAAQAQRLGGGGAAPDISLVRVVAALVVCVAAAIGLVLVIKGRKGDVSLRWPGRFARAIAAARRIEVIETRRVSAFADVCLIRCDRTEYLLVCGPSGQSVLHQSDQDMPLAEGSGNAR